MTKHKENRSFSSFGFSTILLSFVMICVVTFSALSFMTAYSDYKLSKKAADKTIAYYAAQEQCFKRLEAVEALLKESFQSTTDETSYYALLEEQLPKYGTVTTLASSLILSFKEEIAQNQYLTVTLLLPYPTKEQEAFYEIIVWKSVYTEAIFEEKPLDLIH